MSPQSLLRRLCQRHGLPAGAGERLLPLLERAREARPAVRRRLLCLVDGALEREAARRTPGAADAAHEEHLLRAVAGVLHRWQGLGGDDPERSPSAS
jgi:hypothetical protein